MGCIVAIAGHPSELLQAQTVSVELAKRNVDFVVASQVSVLDLPAVSPKVQKLKTTATTPCGKVSRLVKRIEQLLDHFKPVAVVTFGLSDAAIAAALCCSRLGVPLVHVGAGLRSFDRTSMEERTRILLDHTATLLLCPSVTAAANLRRENIRTIPPDGQMVPEEFCTEGISLSRGPIALNVGDVEVEALAFALGERRTRSSGDYALIALSTNFLNHGSLGDSRARQELLEAAVHDLSKLGIDLFAVYEQPSGLWSFDRTDTNTEKRNDPSSFVFYELTLRLIESAAVLITDSTQMQRDAFLLRTPCVSLCNVTPLVETVALGWNVLAGTDPTRIRMAVLRFLHSHPSRPAVNPYGDGRATMRVVRLLTSCF